MNARLRLTRAPSDLLGRTYDVDAAGGLGVPLIIGRAADAHVSLEVQSISRRHATLTPLDEGRWQIADEGSRNGIAVNGTLVQTAVLNDGDEIAFGVDLAAVFERPGSGRPGRAPEGPATNADAALVPTHRRSPFDAAVILVRIEGRVDGDNYTDFRAGLNGLIDAGNSLLILDFSGCAFCDHVGLSVVLGAKTMLDRARGGLCLVGLHQELRDALSRLRLDTLLAIEADEVGAVRRLVR
jgi:anti-anti-sigma factor